MNDKGKVLVEELVQMALLLPDYTSSGLGPNPDLCRKKSVSKRLNRSNFIYIHKVIHLDVCKTKKKNL